MLLGMDNDLLLKIYSTILSRIFSLPVFYMRIYLTHLRTIILSVVLYGSETWSVISEEEHRMSVFENRIWEAGSNRRLEKTAQEPQFYSEQNIITSWALSNSLPTPPPPSPFGLYFHITFGIVLFTLLTWYSQLDLYCSFLSTGSTFTSSKISSLLLWGGCIQLFFWKISLQWISLFILFSEGPKFTAIQKNEDSQCTIYFYSWRFLDQSKLV